MIFLFNFLLKATQNLDVVNKTISKIQKTVDHLKVIVDSNKDKNYPSKQEDLRSTLKISNLTLENTNKVVFCIHYKKKKFHNLMFLILKNKIVTETT